MSTPSDGDVKADVREELLQIFRRLQVVQAAVERAEAAFSGGDFSTVTSALDDATDNVWAAREATD